MGGGRRFPAVAAQQPLAQAQQVVELPRPGGPRRCPRAEVALLACPRAAQSRGARDRWRPALGRPGPPLAVRTARHVPVPSPKLPEPAHSPERSAGGHLHPVWPPPPRVGLTDTPRGTCFLLSTGPHQPAGPKGEGCRPFKMARRGKFFQGWGWQPPQELHRPGGPGSPQQAAWGYGAQASPTGSGSQGPATGRVSGEAPGARQALGAGRRVPHGKAQPSQMLGHPQPEPEEPGHPGKAKA